MLRKIFSISVLILAAFAFSAAAQDKTKVNNQTGKRLLLGRHMVSLQWISWDYFGRADVTVKNGVYRLKGEQKARKGDDFVKIDGVITEINRYDFKFDGKVTMQISHINGGQPCVREGEMNFKITGKRKYWRLQEMDNPCDQATDYVDIYLR
ncbi:MAG: hypothetical protein KDB79_04660 [Acidobacteria bacterium]|nr:hypothetical protein [Acidobacteriota bacterium]